MGNIQPIINDTQDSNLYFICSVGDLNVKPDDRNFNFIILGKIPNKIFLSQPIFYLFQSIFNIVLPNLINILMWRNQQYIYI